MSYGSTGLYSPSSTESGYSSDNPTHENSYLPDSPTITDTAETGFPFGSETYDDLAATQGYTCGVSNLRKDLSRTDSGYSTGSTTFTTNSGSCTPDTPTFGLSYDSSPGSHYSTGVDLSMISASCGSLTNGGSTQSSSYVSTTDDRQTPVLFSMNPDQSYFTSWLDGGTHVDMGVSLVNGQFSVSVAEPTCESDFDSCDPMGRESAMTAASKDLQETVSESLLYSGCTDISSAISLLSELYANGRDASRFRDKVQESINKLGCEVRFYAKNCDGTRNSAVSTGQGATGTGDRTQTDYRGSLDVVTDGRLYLMNGKPVTAMRRRRQEEGSMAQPFL